MWMGGVSAQVLRPSRKTKMMSTVNQIRCHLLVLPSREPPSPSAPVLPSLVRRLDGRSSRKCFWLWLSQCCIFGSTLDNTFIRVSTGLWKCRNFLKFFMAWKVLEKKQGRWKSLNVVLLMMYASYFTVLSECLFVGVLLCNSNVVTVYVILTFIL